MQSIFLIQIHNYAVVSIFWNIFLALIPCAIIYFIIHITKVKRFNTTFILLFLIWLFMLPNTAYLFFMTRHIVNYCTELNSYRVCESGSWIPLFFFAYALIGVPTFYYSLNKMTKIVTKLYCHVCKILFPLFIIPLVSIGLMLGLYERANSWNIINHPFDLIKTVESYFTNFVLLKDFLIFTIILYFIYFGANHILNND